MQTARALLRIVAHFTILAASTVSAPAETRLGCQPFQLQAYRQQYNGGDQCWEKEKGLRGATEYCCNLAFGGMSDCNRDDARTNIQWVFENAGARATYTQGRRGGLSPFQACLRAQGHNARAAQSIRACPGVSIFFCNQKDRELRGDSTAPVGCESAEKSVLWVLFLDARAHLTYTVAQLQVPRWDALLMALNHDPAAQNNVKICRQWVDQFLDENDPRT